MIFAPLPLREPVGREIDLLEPYQPVQLFRLRAFRHSFPEVMAGVLNTECVQVRAA